METSAQEALALLARGAPDVEPHSELASVAGVCLTALDVAAGAAIAECGPEHLPLLLAATRAMAEQRLNLPALLESGDPASLTVIVSGSAVHDLTLDTGPACLGGAVPPNAAIARALSLALRRSAGSDVLAPWFCFGEDESQSPWPSLTAERGINAGTPAVTLFATLGFVPIMLYGDAVADEILQTLARALTVAGLDEAFGLVGGGEPLLVLSAELAQRLQREGYDRSATRRELWRRARLRLRDLAAATRGRVEAARRARGESDPEGALPVALRSAEISLAVTGGAGLRAVYLPGWPGGTRSASRAVETGI